MIVIVNIDTSDKVVHMWYFYCVYGYVCVFHEVMKIMMRSASGSQVSMNFVITLVARNWQLPDNAVVCRCVWD